MPATVEINGASVPVSWQHKANSTRTNPRHVVFVYESAQPHLRLRWEWQARADFGPIEHRITIENLGDKEVWLPMIDSLRLDWNVPAADELRNFYVEKGAGTPSPQGTHLETHERRLPLDRHIVHLRPSRRKAQPREIIPAEIVFSRGIAVRLVRGHRVQRPHAHQSRTQRRQA